MRVLVGVGFGLLATLAGCSDDELADASVGGAGAAGTSAEEARHLIVVTERESPEVAMQ